MDRFRNFLKQDFMQRKNINHRYSLRSYAKFLDINHATLSSILSGKRKITNKTILNLADRLNIAPQLRKELLSQSISPEEEQYYILQQSTFEVISEWYYDAILELSRIPNLPFNSETVSQSLNISSSQATEAISKLVNLGLLIENRNGHYSIKYLNSTNILGPNYTSIANRNYQKSILNKSMESIENVAPENRSHTSTTLAIDSKKLLKVKKIISDFRKQLTNELQSQDQTPDEVFQLQVSFFPLSKNSNLNCKESK